MMDVVVTYLSGIGLLLAFFSVVDCYFVITSLSSSNSASLNVGRIVSDPTNYNGSFGFTSSRFYLNADSVQLAVLQSNISSYQDVSRQGGNFFYGNDVSSPKLYKLLTNQYSPNYISLHSPGELDALELIDPSNNNVYQRVVLSQPIFLGFGSAIFSGDGVILAADGDTRTVYSIDVHTGDVNVTSGCLLRWQTTNSFLSQGIAETNTSSFSIVYGNSNGNIERQSLLDSDVTTISNLEFDRLGMITMDMTSQRWWFYYAGHGPFDDNSASRNESLILGYADATYQTQPNSAPAITQITVTTTTTTAVLSCSFQLKSPYGGTVYCAAYDATMTTPPTPTASNIIAAGFSMSFQALQTVVNVTIVGLSATTDYHTFCYVLSNNQEGSSVQEIQNTERFIQTKCCKTLSYTNQPLFVYSNPIFYSSNTVKGSSGNTISAVTSFNNYLYTFVFVLSALPNRNITIIPRIYDTQTSEVLSSSILKVVPDIFTFTNSSPSKQGSFTLQPQVLNITQKYLLILNVTGVSASQYRASSSYFYLLNSTTIPSPPKLSNAIFGDSGTDAYYVFDSPTNAGGYNYQQTFRCSNIFAFQNANLSSCYWLNATTVRALFPSSILMNTNTSRLINVGDIITVLANRIKSQCSLVIPWLLTSCAGVPYAPQSSTLLAAPYHPTPPVLVIAAPAAVASCVDLVIDTTASSGNCNRPFLSAVWSVYSIDGNADLVALTKFMNNYSPDVYRIYTIPRGSLGTGSYTFSLTVQNFLGQVATSSVTVLASPISDIPQVMIKNGQSMEIFANQRLMVNSIAALPACASSSNTARLQFLWQISALKQVTQISFLNEAVDPASYELKSYSLSPGGIYILKLTVNLLLPNSNHPLGSANSQITISVKYGMIQAIIAGGDERYVPSDRFLILDGKKSRDQDLPSTKANFIFSWSCSLVSFYQFNTPCDGIFESEVTETTGRNKGKVVIRGDLVQPDYSYSVQLIIATDDGRTSSTSVIIKHSKSNGAYTEITNLLKRFNSDANLTVGGIVQANTSVALSWRAFTADENITLVTYTPIELRLPVEYVNQAFSFPVVVKASTFSPGMAITFQLSVVAYHGSNSTTSSSAITLIANGPPRNGIFSVSPKSGTALSTDFFMEAQGWIDEPDDYPLQYAFYSRLQVTSPSLTLQTYSPRTYLTTQLSSALESFNYVLTLIVEVQDRYNAFANATTTAKVTAPGSNINVTNYLNSNLQQGFATSNNQIIFTTINNVANVLNTINCSLANTTYCLSLHRDVCSTTPQTCGSCLPGYDGIVGPSNTLCQLKGTSKPIGSPCTDNNECLYNTCFNNTCVVPMMSCPSAFQSEICSGHGTCSYRNPGGVEYSEPCLITNTFCEAVCFCESGYGNEDCSLSSSQLTEAEMNRVTMCQAINELYNQTTPSAHVTDSLITSLNVVYSPSQVVSEESEAVCQNSILLITDLVESGYLSGGNSENTAFLIETVSNYIKTSPTGSKSYLDDVIKRLIPGILSTMAQGQTPFQFPMKNVRLSLQKELIQSLISSDDQVVNLLPPATAEVDQYNSQVTRIQFVGTSAAGCNSGSGYSHYSLMQYGNQNPLANASKILSTTFQFAGTFASNKIASSIHSTTTNSSKVFRLNETAYYVVLQFLRNEYTFNSSSLLNQRIVKVRSSHITSGQKRANTTFPVCKLYEDGNLVDCGNCNISSYTPYNVTFLCRDVRNLCRVDPTGQRRLMSSNIVESTAILPKSSSQDAWSRYLEFIYSESIFTSEEKRRVLAGDDDYFSDDSTSIGSGLTGQEFASLLEAAEIVFVNVLASNPFDVNIEQAKVVLSLVGGLILAFLAGAVFFVAWDSFDKNQFIYGNVWPPKTTTGMSIQRWSRWWLQGFDKRKQERKEEKQRKYGFYLPFLYPTQQSPKKGYDSDDNQLARGLPVPPRLPKRRKLLKRIRTKSKIAGSHFRLRDANKYLFSSDINEFFNLIIPEFFYYQKWLALGKAILRKHDYTSVFFFPFGEKTRLMRWMDLFNNILNGLFISTLFFGVFYSNTGECESFLNEKDCLAPLNSITGLTQCLWTSGSDDDQVDDAFGSCSLNQPPSNMSFVVILALVCVLIGAPLKILISFIIDNFCSQRPVLEDIGFSTEYWFGRGVQTQEISYQSEQISELLENVGNFNAETNSGPLNPNVIVETGLKRGASTRRVNSNKLSDTQSVSLGFLPYPDKRSTLVRSLSQYVQGIEANERVIELRKDTHSDPSRSVVKDEEKMEQLSRAFYQSLSTEEELKDCLHLAYQHYNLDLSFLTYFKKSEIDLWLQYYHATTEQILRFIGMQSDGSFRRLTLQEMILHRSAIKKFSKKLEKAREKSSDYAKEIEEVEAVHRQLPEVYLLYKFILEQLSPFKRWIMRDQLLCFQGFFPSTIPFHQWLLAWAFVIGVYVFYCYWIFAWGVANGELLLSDWAWNFVIGAGQDIFFVTIVKILSFYVIAVIAIKPQLLEIKQLLKVLSISLSQQDQQNKKTDKREIFTFSRKRLLKHQLMQIKLDREKKKQEKQRKSSHRRHLSRNQASESMNSEALGSLSDSTGLDFSIVQHLSPTCRLAWRNRYHHLFMSRLLRLIDDYDIIQLQSSARLSTGTVGAILIFMPLLLTFVGAFFAEFLFDVLLPLFSSSLILANYYLFTLSVDYIILIWVFVFGSCIWYYGIVRKASKFTILKRSPAGFRNVSQQKNFLKGWTMIDAASEGWQTITKHATIFLVRQKTKSPSLWREVLRDLKLGFSHTLLPAIAWTDPKYHDLVNTMKQRREEQTWRCMNLPLELQGKVGIDELAHKEKFQLTASLEEQIEWVFNMPKRYLPTETVLRSFSSGTSFPGSAGFSRANSNPSRPELKKSSSFFLREVDREVKEKRSRERTIISNVDSFVDVVQTPGDHEEGNMMNYSFDEDAAIYYSDFDDDEDERNSDYDDNDVMLNIPIAIRAMKYGNISLINQKMFHSITLSSANSASPYQQKLRKKKEDEKEALMQRHITDIYKRTGKENGGESQAPKNPSEDFHIDSLIHGDQLIDSKRVKELIIEIEETKFPSSPHDSVRIPSSNAKTVKKRVTLQHIQSNDYIQQLLNERYLQMYPWDDYVFYQQLRQSENMLGGQRHPHHPRPTDRRGGDTLSNQFKRHHFVTTNLRAAIHHMIFLYFEKTRPHHSYEEYQEMTTIIMIQGWRILILKDDLLDLFYQIWDVYYPNGNKLTIPERKELKDNLNLFLQQHYFSSSNYINFYYFTEWFIEIYQQYFHNDKYQRRK
eukprot:gene2641-2808_t